MIASMRESVKLLEADIPGVLTEASPTHVQAVLPDEAVVIGADSAATRAGSILAWMREPDVLLTHSEREHGESVV